MLSFENLRYLDDIFLKESVFALPVSLAMVTKLVYKYLVKSIFVFV